MEFGARKLCDCEYTLKHIYNSLVEHIVLIELAVLLLQLSLSKTSEVWWNAVLKGEKEIDIDQINRERSMATVDEEEHAVLDRLTFDYQQKLQGKPQSHEMVRIERSNTQVKNREDINYTELTRSMIWAKVQLWGWQTHKMCSVPWQSVFK